jgi:hypothetical protein
LPAAWCDYDPLKKQFTQTPKLPLPPRAKPPVAATPPTAPPAPVATKRSLPHDGQELHRRLRDYDQKLATEKVCNLGSLLAYVSQAGQAAGFGPDMTTWTGEAIPLAVAKVKEFEAKVRANTPDQKSVA